MQGVAFAHELGHFVGMLDYKPTQPPSLRTTEVRRYKLFFLQRDFVSFRLAER